MKLNTMLLQKRPPLRSLLMGAFLVIVLAWLAGGALIVVRGLACREAKADLTVVFGNGLTGNGAPAPILASRLDVAARCYRAGNCPLLFVSGSIDGPGRDEAKTMRDYLLAHGVSADHVISDNAGDNTLTTVRHAVAYMAAHRLASVLIVSQFYHLPRARLAFRRAGIAQVYGVYPELSLTSNIYPALREVPAYLIYAIRLEINPDSRLVSFRPVWFLKGLLHKMRL